MRINKEALLKFILALPPDESLVIEICEDRMEKNVRCATAWALASYFQAFHPSNRVSAFIVSLGTGVSLPDPYALMEECLVREVAIISRDANGVPQTALFYRRGDDPAKGRRYPFFLIPDDPFPDRCAVTGALVLFNGGHAKPFIRELLKLARDAGFPVTATLIHRSTSLARGAVSALAERIAALDEPFDTIICARDPGERAVVSLSELTGKRVLTREDIIVSLFEKRATGHSGKLTASASAIEREKVRHHERLHGLSRITGGVLGARGPGETVKEERKRLLKRREARIRKALEKERDRRDRQRQFRSRIAYPTVAIVGYTNAGKSTLFNAIVGEQVVRSANEFFSSIDPKIRLVTLWGKKVFLLDTVGFIEGMSSGVLDAFAPTFDEIRHAALVLHIVDPTEHGWRRKKEEVDRVLTLCSVSDEKVEILYSKRDLCNPMTLAGDGISAYSASDRNDIRNIKRLVYKRLFGETV